jgi:molybdopterin-synthase adenylyltransferase
MTHSPRSVGFGKTIPTSCRLAQALEILREIVGFGEGLVGRLLMLDARGMRFETLRYGWDPPNPLSGEHPTIHDSSAHG